MCHFKSAIVVQDETVKDGFRLLMSPWTESHSDLCTMFKLNDTVTARLYFARVEFSPSTMETAHQPETYKLTLDEDRTPDWWTDEIKARVTECMAAYIRSIIVTGDVALLIGGQFIITPGANVKCAKACIINAMISATIGVMWGSAKVGEMWGSANVGVMRESATIGEMRESANVGVMWGSANVGEMRESATIGEMLESANVGVMWGSANVGVMWESAKVEKDKRNK